MTDSATPLAITPTTDHPERGRAVSQFAYVDRAFRDVRRYLVAAPTRIIEPTAELHVRRMGLDLVREVRMTMGDIEVGTRNARLLLRWEDAARPELFPVLDATFELNPVSAGTHPMTQLGLFGRYQAPLGRLGALADTVAGHRIVLESVEGFLDDLARRLERDLPAPEPNVARPDSPTAGGWRRIILTVDDLSRRPGGAAGLQLLLTAQAGVISASVNPTTELAIIDYAPGSCRVSHLLRAIDGAWS